MLDESSLASTKQVRDFLAKLEPSDRVLLIGDTCQHQGVEAGKPFEQLVVAGMKTTQLDQIVRQKDAPELLQAVEHLSRGEVAEGVALLERQGRVTEIADAQQRIAAIARSYAANPDNTIVVSPDNASRRQINQAVRSELQAIGSVAAEDHAMRVLAPRSDMTRADRTWAARYAVNDVLHYPRGSQDIGIEKQSYTKVIATQPQDNLLTVQKEDGKTVTYNPARLYCVTAYRELEREFAVGDRLSFTAPSKALGVANRDLFPDCRRSVAARLYSVWPHHLVIDQMGRLMSEEGFQKAGRIQRARHVGIRGLELGGRLLFIGDSVRSNHHAASLATCAISTVSSMLRTRGRCLLPLQRWCVFFRFCRRIRPRAIHEDSILTNHREQHHTLEDQGSVRLIESLGSAIPCITMFRRLKPRLSVYRTLRNLQSRSSSVACTTSS